MLKPCKPVVLTLTLSLSLQAMPGIGIPATEWTQLLNHAQLIMQKLTLAKQLAAQLEQLKNMSLQGKLLTGIDLIHETDELAQLAAVVRQGQGLAYTMGNLDSVFRRVYPGYLQAGGAFDPQYRQWSKVNLDTIAGVLASISVQARQVSTDQQSRMIIRNFTQSAVGQNQILQAGVMMADQEANQLQGLRQIMWNQTLLAANAQGKALNDDAVRQDIRANAYAPARFVAVN